MASGWRFSVTVPSWTQTTLEGDELVVVSPYVEEENTLNRR